MRRSLSRDGARGMAVYPLLLSVLLIWLLPVSALHGHGSVVDEGDACLIRIGDFYRAHFSMFQPRTRQHREFCEDVPDVTDTIFTLDYQHAALARVPVDFRIIRNPGLDRRFVRWQDIEALGELGPLTEFHVYMPPQPDGVLTLMHEFRARGDYIGLISAPHPDGHTLYRAVFPFRVGRSAVDYWPWAAALLLAASLGWRWRRARRSRYQEASNV